MNGYLLRLGGSVLTSSRLSAAHAESMNLRSSEMLSNPQQCGHILYTYTEESQVTEAVCLFAGAGLRRGEAVLLVMAEAHREPILQGSGMKVSILTPPLHPANWYARERKRCCPRLCSTA